MRKKSENKLHFYSRPKWIVTGIIIILIFTLIVLTPVGKILSLKGVFIPNISPTPKIQRIPVTAFPLNIISKDDYLNMAVDDLNKIRSIGKEKIIVKSVETKDWPDTSLGCPTRGKMYAQVITPGYLITLQANGKNYLYHAGLKRVIFCPGN